MLSTIAMGKIYTRSGDEGETGLIGGARVRKDHPRVTACGTVDELNALLGVVRAELAAAQSAVDQAELARMNELIAQLQHQLLDVGAELATPKSGESGHFDMLGKGAVARLEAAIDDYSTRLEPLRQFILPGGSQIAAQLHLARAICRRAERCIVAIQAETPVRGELLCYINRLSDLLFVMARAANDGGKSDVLWVPGDNRS